MLERTMTSTRLSKPSNNIKNVPTDHILILSIEIKRGSLGVMSFLAVGGDLTELAVLLALVRPFLQQGATHAQ